MITLYYFPTPNGKKVSIALEEMGLPYSLEIVQIFNNDQLRPEYLEICPNGRIPALVDHEADGTHIRIFESGAILQYLGRKSGLFYPILPEGRRAWVDAWVFWQMAGLGPMTGQITWFKRAAGKPGRDPHETSLPIHRFTKEVKRLYGVLERQLAGREYICDEYTIADMASWPWVDQHHGYLGDLREYPNIRAWHARIAARPTVERATKVGVEQVQGPSNRAL